MFLRSTVRPDKKLGRRLLRRAWSGGLISHFCHHVAQDLLEAPRSAGCSATVWSCHCRTVVTAASPLTGLPMLRFADPATGCIPEELVTFLAEGSAYTVEQYLSDESRFLSHTT